VSVKWLERLELRSEPAPNTARITAIARLRTEPVEVRSHRAG
jgi:hypothetical protein